MSKRIGEVLIQRGLLNGVQLERALKAQLILGGHLGTCLIEMGFVDEADLGGALSEIFGVPYADPDVIRYVPKPVIARVPARLAERHRVIPIDVDAKVLRLAMVNPRDLQALDEIHFATGLSVEAWVSPEVRIVEALERHYGVERRARYITICRELDRRVEVGAAVAARARAYAPPAAREATSSTAAAEVTTIGEAGVDPEAYGYGRSWTEIVSEGEVGDQSGRDGATEQAAKKVEEPLEESLDVVASLEDVAFLLCGADEIDHVASAALMYVGSVAPRSALFMVKDGFATVWNARGLKASPGKLAAVRTPVTSGWIFKLLGGHEYYRGPFPPEAEPGSLHVTLGLPAPSEAIVVPVHLNDRLVAILYADGGSVGTIQEGTGSFLRLGGMVALALNLIILKRKILTS